MSKLIGLTIVALVCFKGGAVMAQTDLNKSPDGPCVVVTGAVRAPRRLEVKEKRLRVDEALVFAGGLNERASGTIKLIETQQSCYQEAWAHKVWPDRKLKVTDLTVDGVARGDEKTNPYLNPGDVILVDEMDQTYVVGKVLRPQIIYFKESLSLLGAIAMAGGAVGVTSDTRVVIFRPGADGFYKEFSSTDLSQLLKHRVPDPLLHPHDIINVGPVRTMIPEKVFPSLDPPFNKPLAPRPYQIIRGISTL